eukprot:351948-Chlamydomonas_euryale.AAC.8
MGLHTQHATPFWAHMPVSIAALARPSPDAPRRAAWRLLHHSLGAATILIGWITIFLGIGNAAAADDKYPDFDEGPGATQPCQGCDTAMSRVRHSLAFTAAGTASVARFCSCVCPIAGGSAVACAEAPAIAVGLCDSHLPNHFQFSAAEWKLSASSNNGVEVICGVEVVCVTLN